MSPSSSGPRSPSTYRACPTALPVRGFGCSAPSSSRYFSAAAYQCPIGLTPMCSAAACGATGVPGLSGSLGVCSSCNSFTPRRICSPSRLVRSSVTFDTPTAARSGLRECQPRDPAANRELLDGLLEGLARSEGWNLAGPNLHRLPGLGVLALPGLLIPDVELAEARDLNLLARFERSRYGCRESFQVLLGFALG